MKGHWAHLGHTLGECFYDSTKHITYVNVPKNASSYVKSVLIGCANFVPSETLIDAEQYLVILRDPIERWISGAAQVLTNDKELTLEYIIKHITVDDHTETQSYFLQNVDLAKCTFIKVDDCLSDNLKLWLSNNGYVYVDKIFIANQGSALIKEQITKVIASDAALRLRLSEHFVDDYKLINSVKFYD